MAAIQLLSAVSPQGLSGQSSGNAPITSIERAIEEAQTSGELILTGRGLRDIPKQPKCDLSDVTCVDLTGNRFEELPPMICDFLLLDRLTANRNIIRSLPQRMAQLQSLTFLSLCSNQLSQMPACIFQLHSLEVLLLRNNRLTQLQAEIVMLDRLLYLDISHNFMESLPSQIGNLDNLRYLNARRNSFTSLPRELCRLPLVVLDVSENVVDELPPELAEVHTLEVLLVDGNPLRNPPSRVTSKGREHLLKALFNSNAANSSEIDGFANARGLAPNAESRRSGRASNSANSSCSGMTPSFALRRRPVIDRERRIAVASSDSGYSTVGAAVDDEADKAPESNQQPQVTMHRRKSASVTRLGNEAASGDTSQQQAENNGDVENTESSGTNSGLLMMSGVVSRAPKTRRPSEESQKSNHIKSVVAGSYDLPPSHSPAMGFRPGEPLTIDASVTPSTPAAPVNLDSSDSSGGDVALADGNSEQTLRNLLESFLHLKLPEEIGEALRDGVMLCHLANSLRPRTIPSIQVPSAGTNNLSASKCRRNAENFVEACRKIGLREEFICSAHDILYSDPDGVSRLTRTVASLIGLVQTGKQAILNQRRASTASSAITDVSTASTTTPALSTAISPKAMSGSWHPAMFGPPSSNGLISSLSSAVLVGPSSTSQRRSMSAVRNGGVISPPGSMQRRGQPRGTSAGSSSNLHLRPATGHSVAFL